MHDPGPAATRRCCLRGCGPSSSPGASTGSAASRWPSSASSSCASSAQGAGETALVLTCFGVATIPSRILGGHLADAGDTGRRCCSASSGARPPSSSSPPPPPSAARSSAPSCSASPTRSSNPRPRLSSPTWCPSATAPSPTRPSTPRSPWRASSPGLVAAAVSGLGLRWLFVVDAATCLACALLVATRIPSHQQPNETAPSTGRKDERQVGHRHAPGWAGALTDRRLRPVVAFGTVVATVTMVVVLGVPLLVEQRGLAPATTGWVLAAGAAASVPGAWLAAVLRGAPRPWRPPRRRGHRRGRPRADRRGRPARRARSGPGRLRHRQPPRHRHDDGPRRHPGTRRVRAAPTSPCWG